MRPPNAVPLRIVPCGITSARVAVARWHRHHRPPVGGLVAFEALCPRGLLVGAVVVGRPVSRHLQAQGWVEVTRLATDGTPNVCSALYGAASRWAKRNGHTGIVTYTLDVEGGGSLRGAGWVQTGETTPKAWTCASRPRHARKDEAHGKRRWSPPWCAGR
jgi:hypothetical protein